MFRTIRRRAVLRLGVLGGACIVARGIGTPVDAVEPPRGAAIPRFALPLKILPELEPTTRMAAHDEYTIVQRGAAQEILPGPLTTSGAMRACFRVLRFAPLLIQDRAFSTDGSAGVRVSL